MTAVRMYFTGERVGPKFKRMTERFGSSVRNAVRAAAQEVADNTLERGKADIASAGNFGTRWQEGLHVNVTEGGGSIRVAVTHDLLTVGFRVHQFGATIHAKNPTGFLFLHDRDGKIFAKVRQVTIPKRFHVLEIAREEARKIGDYFRAAVAARKGR